MTIALKESWGPNLQKIIVKVPMVSKLEWMKERQTC